MWTRPFFFHISAFIFLEKTKFVLVEAQSNAAAPAANKGTLTTDSGLTSKLEVGHAPVCSHALM